jgi:hypothetical protein
MAKVFLKKTLRGFEPADEPSQEAMKRFKVGEIAKADVVKPRSYQHHKLAFALLTLTFNNQERYAMFEQFRKAVALAAGHVEELVKVNGEIIELPGSLSYDALDQVEFEKVFANMMRVCAEDFLRNTDQAVLRAEVEQYAAEHFS